MIIRSLKQPLWLMATAALAWLPSLSLAQNVLQPGDPIIASSSNSPGSEGVANAIDGTQAKYLNFDAATAGKVTGFVVTPSIGVTRVTGIAVESANDAPDRDVKSMTLEGSNDATVTNFASGNWELIYSNANVASWTSLFPNGDRFQTQTFPFENFKAYKHYRWTVLATQGPSTCCMQVAEVQLLGNVLPGVVTVPGDPIIASSANSPGSEGVANAIDRTQAKYLNFDAATAGKVTGFVVTPSLGSTVLTGITMESANDAPDRDPQSITIEGSNDDSVTNFAGGNWTLIYTNAAIPSWPSLFPGGDRFQNQTFLFDNVIPFKHYRWTVLATQGPSTCCMQIAEVSLLGTTAPKDVFQPGDPIIASSSNSPGSEGVANAIDGTQAKYLNFDAATAGKVTGFVATPSIGASVITGMAIESANDAPDRDVKSVTIEGSNDSTVTNFASGNWTLIYANNNIASWPSLFPNGDRFQTQTFYFPNQTAYKHYRWTVLATQGPSTCCMQVAEVQLLAVTQSNPCGQVAFTAPPVNTPALNGQPATLMAGVNGPWTLQWLMNGTPIPGATAATYTTAPVTPQTATNLYACAIVGCQTSAPVQATVFLPSTTKSIGINFRGGGANGAPTATDDTDIAGVQAQAHWNVATNASGMTGDGTALPDSLLDSDGNASTVTFQFQTSGTWGAGVGTASPTARILNGLTVASPGTEATMTFGNVPVGTTNSVLIYVVSPPLQFQEAYYAVTGATARTNYIRALNSDEYKVAPGFYSGSSTDVNNPTIADFVRFDNVVPDSGGNITVTFDTITTGYDRGTGVNAIQLLLKSTSPGAPPTITQDPQPTVAPTNGTAVVSVQATGNNLTYQWRKDGKNLVESGVFHGTATSTLTITPFSPAAVGVYSVAVFSPAGSTVSKNAAVRLTKYNISDSLAGYWKFDQTSGTVAPNSVTGGQVGVVNGTAAWAAGQIANALTLDGTSTYVFVTNYPLATKQIAGSAWVKVTGAASADMAIFRNGQGNSFTLSGANRIHGQFDLGLSYNSADGSLTPSAAIGIGPNVARATAPAPLASGAWHHLAFTGDGAQLRLYVDGKQAAVSDYLADINPPDVAYLSMGAWLNVDTNNVPPLGVDATNPNYLAGGLDDVALWDRALTADEVAAIYTAGSQGQPLSSVVITPPVAIKLTITSSASGVTISWDKSITGYNLQSSPTVKSPTWTVVPGVVNNSITVSPTSTLFYRLSQ